MNDTLVDARNVAPGDLIIAANVRSDTKVDKTFVSSIKQHGVLVPILAEPGEGDTLEVVDGQRRVLAAIEAGLATVPVLVSTDREDAQRIIEQLVVNDHRAELSDSEHSAAYQQLSLFGISADAIARKTNAPRKRVETAIAVAASPVAAKVLAEQPVTLDQAAVIVEFEDDEADVARLVEAAGTGRIDHEAAQIRDRRTRESLIADAERAAAADGWRIVDEPEDGGQARRIDRLYTDEKHTTRLTTEAHAECPGRAVYVELGRNWSASGMEYEARTIEVCDDYAVNGHFRYVSSSGPAGGPLSDEEKAKRKESRENNKLWGPATTVRIEWIQQLLQRNDLPSGWELFVALYVARGGEVDYRSKGLTATLLGTEKSSLVDWLTDNPTRGPQLLIAAAIAHIEGEYEYAKKGWDRAASPAYLKQLSAWGYTLSELEETIARKAGK